MGAQRAETRHVVSSACTSVVSRATRPGRNRIVRARPVRNSAAAWANLAAVSLVFS